MTDEELADAWFAGERSAHGITREQHLRMDDRRFVDELVAAVPKAGPTPTQSLPKQGLPPRLRLRSCA